MQNELHNQTPNSFAARGFGRLLLTASIAATAILSADAQQIGGPLSKHRTGPLDLPPSKPDAGGDNVPNLGMWSLYKQIIQFGGHPPSSAINMFPDTVIPDSPAPLGLVLETPPIYLPDFAPEGVTSAEHFALLDIGGPENFPDPLYFSNSDPSGSLDETAMDADGNPIHFNLHWPQRAAEPFWLDEFGIEGSSPNDDLEEILDEIAATGSKQRVQEALDILLGTNVSGALSKREYNGFPLLKIYKAADNRTYDPETRNIVVKQLWYGNEILSDCQLLQVPAHGEFTITWQLRGLGDIGENREFAFPIDDVSTIPMKETTNAAFWSANAWIWKWFDAIEHSDGRRYAQETLYELHTGTDAAPSYADLNPGDPRTWLHADRKFNFGSYVGEGDLFDFYAWETYDLDQSGDIGGYLLDGTNTGAAYDASTNPDAQFNQYGNNEYAVPRVDWSKGPYHIPYFGYDSTFTVIRKGQGVDVTVRYSEGEMQAGLYTWGWRVHPPRISWIETYADGQMLPSGAPKQWRFAHKWDQLETLGLDAIGDNAPEKIIHNALVAFRDGAGGPVQIQEFSDTIEGMMAHIRDRRGLPPTPGVANFPNPAADANLLFTNLDIYGDRDRIASGAKASWDEGDVVTLTIHNDDKIERYFRVVDFGTTDYQYCGTDMGLLDWKPVFGFPQLAPAAWNPNAFIDYPFDAQGAETAFWNGSALAGTGNPFYVSPQFEDLANFWKAGSRDLQHTFTDLTGFSGPGFTSEFSDPFSFWANQPLKGLPTGDPNMWSYSYGKPIAPGATVTFDVEMPRAAALNNGAMYIFDPQFHSSSIFTMHPRAEIEPEGLAD